MGKKKAPELPMYDLYSDNIYQADNRKLSEGLGNWLNTNWSNIDASSPEFNSAAKAYAGSYNNMVRNELANNYSAPNNARALTGRNTGLYNTNMQDLYQSDLDRRVESSNAAMYGQLANQYFNNQLANLTARYLQYVPSGEDINAADKLNNNIINQNLDREYQNRLMREAQKGNPWNIVKGTVKGFMTGGPIGAITGGVGSALNEYTDFGGIYSGLMKGLNVAGGLGAAYAGFTGK